jgi:hypothetical protein
MRDIAGLMIHHQTTAQNFAFSPKKPIEPLVKAVMELVA